MTLKISIFYTNWHPVLFDGREEKVIRVERNHSIFS